MIPYVFSGTGSEASVTFYAEGRQHTVSGENPNFNEVVCILTADSITGLGVDMGALIKLAEPIQVVMEALANTRLPAGTVDIIAGSVLFNGSIVHGHLVDRILEIASIGNVAPWVNFMTNLMQNPSFTARSELYLWLEKAKLPVTPDGHFLAYKKVDHDFLDLYSHTLDYSPGNVVAMARHEVDDDRNNTCSAGLHFCSADYLPSFGVSSGSKVVLVKINPADVVSIPSDYDNTKGRAWRIEVLEDVTEAYREIAWPPVASGADWTGDDWNDDDEPDFWQDDDGYVVNDDDGEDAFADVYRLIDEATDAELGFDDDDDDHGDVQYDDTDTSPTPYERMRLVNEANEMLARESQAERNAAAWWNGGAA